MTDGMNDNWDQGALDHIAETKAKLTTNEKISIFLKELEKFLHEKNKRYGDAALNPLKVFNKGNSSNSILSRMDDKLNRIKNSDVIRKNDIIDLAGYLVLYAIDRDWLDLTNLLD